MERIGEYMRTFTGVKFYPYDPRTEDFVIEDIARHLALQCRFNGGLNRFYSVAQHSCLVADAAYEMSDKDPEMAWWGQFHDAPETWIGDMVRPLKHSQGMAAFRELEREIMRAVIVKFDLRPRQEPELISYIDAAICITEAMQLRDNAHGDVMQVRSGFEPLPIRIFPWSWQRAETEFLERVERYGRLRGR